MTTTASKLAKKWPWKIKQLPTIPKDMSSKLFFTDIRNTPFEIFRRYKAFLFRARPIKTLNRPPLRHLKGPNTIRAFLYAREHWPDRSFIRTAPAAFMALYNSRLKDGLPRVIYVVSKEVEAPLRGKMGSVLRHKFKRKGKSAFKHALEGLRKDDPNYRCDLDICVVLNPETINVPYHELVMQMRDSLLSLKPQITGRGLLNAQRSLPFLTKHYAKPRHVLTDLEMSMGLGDTSPEALQKVREDIKREKKEQLEIEKAEKKALKGVLPVSAVRGRITEMLLMEDGSLEPLPLLSEEQDLSPGDNKTPIQVDRTPEVSGASIRSRDIRGKLYTAVAKEPFTSKTREKTVPIQRINPLSDWNVEELDQFRKADETGAPEASTMEPVTEGFDYLFAQDASTEKEVDTNSAREEKEDGGSREVKLQWPPPPKEEDGE